jgi:DNA replication protein DnaC
MTDRKVDNAKYLEILNAANVPALHRRIKTADLDFTTSWGSAYKKIEAKLGTGFICSILGEKGTGKTQMAVQLCRENAMNYRSCKFTSAMDFFLDLKSSYDGNRVSEKTVIENHISPRLLVIDEIEERGGSDWEDRLLTHLVNKRYEAMRDTVIISNLSASDFNKRVASKIISRMIETGGIIECKWKSFRNKGQQ